MCQVKTLCDPVIVRAEVGRPIIVPENIVRDHPNTVENVTASERHKSPRYQGEPHARMGRHSNCDRKKQQRL